MDERVQVTLLVVGILGMWIWIALVAELVDRMRRALRHLRHEPTSNECASCHDRRNELNLLRHEIDLLQHELNAMQVKFTDLAFQSHEECYPVEALETQEMLHDETVDILQREISTCRAMRPTGDTAGETGL